MLKGNIRLPIILPISSIAISTLFVFLRFTPMSIVIYLGSLYLVTYFTLGYIRRKDALLVDDEKIYVKTPFRYHEWDMNSIKKIYVTDGSSQIKADVIIEEEEQTVTICNNIYSVSINVIYSKIIEISPHLK